MIKRVRVSNYKCLGTVEVDLEPVTVLIGCSGTGKTTFVESLRFLRDYIALRPEIAVKLYGGWGKVLSATASYGASISFRITFTVPGTGEDYQYALTLQQPQQKTVQHLIQAGQIIPFNVVEESLSLGTEVLFDQRNGKWFSPPRVAGTTQPNGVALGSLAGIPEVSRANIFLTSGLGWYSFPDDVLLTSDPQQSNRDLRHQKTTSSTKAEVIGGLWDNGSNFLQAFNAITTNLRAWAEQLEMVAALRKLDRSVAGLALRVPQQDIIVVSHKMGDALLPLELGQESEGLRRFLAILIALYQNPPKVTLIFEEPEKGIHPGALAVLADQFKACAQSGRGQVILTTHSPELLNHFGPETLRAVDITNYQTRIGPVAPDQVQSIRERLLHSGELLTVDPARLAEADHSEK